MSGFLTWFRRGVTFWSDGDKSVDNSPHPRAGERGDREAVGEGFVDWREKQPLTPGFAVPSPLGEGRYQLRPGPAVNSNLEVRGMPLRQEDSA